MFLRTLMSGFGSMLLLCSAGCGETPQSELAEARAKVGHIARWSGGHLEPKTWETGQPILAVDFSRTQVLDATLYFVGKLKSLQSLNLAKCARITDVGVAYLTDLPALQTLDLSGNPWTTDTGVSRLVRNRNLRSLSLAGNQGVTDWCLEHLKELPQLQHLDLRNTRVSERGAKLIKAWGPRIEVLHGNYADVD